MAPAGVRFFTDATPQRVAIAHFLQLLDVCGEDGFTLWVGALDGDVSTSLRDGFPSMHTLIVSPGITQLLGFTQAEYLAASCVCVILP